MIALLGVYSQNPVLAESVGGTGLVSPLDVLLIINTLNLEGTRRIPPGNRLAPFYDVDADGFVSPLDALIVINYLNLRHNGEGEFVRPDVAVPLISPQSSFA